MAASTRSGLSWLARVVNLILPGRRNHSLGRWTSVTASAKRAVRNMASLCAPIAGLRRTGGHRVASQIGAGLRSSKARRLGVAIVAQRRGYISRGRQPSDAVRAGGVHAGRGGGRRDATSGERIVGRRALAAAEAGEDRTGTLLSHRSAGQQYGREMVLQVGTCEAR